MEEEKNIENGMEGEECQVSRIEVLRDVTAAVFLELQGSCAARDEGSGTNFQDVA